MKKHKVSIGISAYNEEKTIGKVLKQLLAQKQDNWQLKEIIIYCDGCKDKTAQIAGKFALNNPKIKVVDDPVNQGKIYRVNQMLRNFKGDIFLMVYADVTIASNYAISAVVKEFATDNEVMLVSGNIRVFPPKSFFQNAIYTSYAVHYKSREYLNNGHNIHGNAGGFLALKRVLAQKVTVPDCLSEDTYIYLLNKQLGHKFRHARGALIHHRLAENLKDYLKQIFRTHPEAISVFESDYFSQELIAKEFARPLPFYIKSILQVFIKNPIGTLYMVGIKLACKPLFPFISGNYKQSWYTAISTKK